MFQIRDESESEANLKVLTKELKSTVAVLKDRVKVEIEWWNFESTSAGTQR